MVERNKIDWVNLRLRKAKLNDVSRDFSDGTVLMELIVLLLPHNKIAVKEALEKFNPTPTSMAHSLSNIETVLTCLAADETHIDVEPLDIFRGDLELIQKVLETLHKKYDKNDPDTSFTSTKEDIIPEDSASTDDIIPENSASTDDIIPENSASTDDIIPENSASTDDIIPENSASTDDIIPENSDSTDDIIPEDSTSTDDIIPEDSTSTDDIIPENSARTDDIVPEDSTSTDDIIPEECTSTDDINPEECNSSGDIIPEECNIKIEDSSQQEDANVAAPFIAEDQGIIIKIKDGDPLCVDKERLIKDSRVFRQFIDELHFYELEMDDFEPDTVGLFLTLLEDRQVDNIQEGQFRELHKMSVVFEVEWLREECRNWLSSRINKENMECNEKLFVFEECLYVLRKWNQSDMMDDLFAKIASTDNSDFITKYFQELDGLDPVQMELMLKLGENKDEMFLKTVLQNLIGKAELGKNVKYLLQRINLVVCSEANNELFITVFNTISNLPDISVADVKFALRLTTETTRLIMISMQKKIDIEKLSNSNNNPDECSDEDPYGSFSDPDQGSEEDLYDHGYDQEYDSDESNDFNYEDMDENDREECNEYDPFDY